MPFSQDAPSILGDEIWLNFSLKSSSMPTIVPERAFMNWFLPVVYHLKMNKWWDPLFSPAAYSMSNFSLVFTQLEG